MPERPHDKARPHPLKREGVEPTARVDPTLPAYAELAVTTNFSFLRGASHPEEYAERAAALGYRAVAIADLHTLAGVVRMHVAGKQAGTPVVIGARVEPLDLADGLSESNSKGSKGSKRVEPSAARRLSISLEAHTRADIAARPGASNEGAQPFEPLEFNPTSERSAGSLLLFPSSRAAYGRLCRLLTLGKRRAPKGACSLTLHDVIEHREGMLAVVVPPDGPGAMDERFIDTLAGLRRAFDDDRLSLAASCGGGADDAGRLTLLSRLATHVGVSMVATNDAHYHDPARRRLQDVLVCIREGVTLERAGPRLFPNDRRCLLSPLEMASLFAAYPSALARSVEVAERALAFGLDQIRYEYPEEICPAGRAPLEHLRALVAEGVWEHISEAARQRDSEEKRGDGTPGMSESASESRDGGARGGRESASGPRANAPPHQPLPNLPLKGRGLPPLQGGQGGVGIRALTPVDDGSGMDDGFAQPLPSPPLKGREEDMLPQSGKHATPLTRSSLPRSFPASLPPALLSRLEHEFRLIEELGYAKYFLTVHDIVRYARSRGILCQGRGAAANSAVCYYLGITSVDPARIDLLFERFVSKERNEPPDIDIDFEHERREEVIQYIYAKYGRDRAALTAEVITYRGRSAVREVGKALGLSLDLVDRMAKQLDWWDKGVVNRELLSQMGVDPDDPTIALTMELSGQLLGFPRHLSQHVGGFVITREPLEEIVPIENAAMPDRTIIEWDKDDIDAMGMLKVDCLGLGMLSAVAKALRLVNSWGVRPDRWSSGRVVEWSSEKDGGDADGERGQEFSRPDRVAEGACDRLGDLRGDTLHAARRGVRPDVADAPGGVLHLAEHRRGIRAAHAPQVHSWPADRRRLPLRTDDRVPDRDGPPADHAGPRDPCDAEGRGPAAVLPDRQARSQGPTGDAPPPLLIDHSSTRPLDHSPLSLHSIPPEDPAVYDMLCRADSVGVFQVESRAQMSMLPRLRPRCYYDLVIEVAIVRPGPIVGDMVHPYLRRRNGEEAVEYPSEAVRGVLGKTLGVPIFQEQAMRLAIVAAGFSAGEADRLRRAMAAWKRKGDKLLAFERPFIDGMLANGYTPEFSRRCFEQLKGFSEYGFPESHAASFAHIVYASAWLKRHHPAAFCAALINSQPMGFYAPAQLVRDAKEHGVEIRPVDVNRSGWDCSLEERWPSGQVAEWSSEASEALGHARPPHSSTRPLDYSSTSPALRLGMRLISGLRQEHAESIAHAVATRGLFSSIEALWRASGVPVAALRRLASADAFGSMGLARRQALWHLRALRDEPLPLFDRTGVEVSRCQGVEAPLPTEPPMHAVAHDYTTTGLSLKAHPMSFYREELSSAGVSSASCLRDVRNWPHGRRIAVAGLVLVRQRPHTASGIVFMTLEDETGIANLIVRPNIYQRDRRAARHAVAMVAWGRVERHGEVIHVLVSRVRELARVIGQGPRLAPMSRDFH